MRHSLWICSTLVFLAACTQSPAMVDNRGAHDYGNGRGHYEMATAAPVAAVTQSAPAVPGRASMDVATVSHSSVMVSDLAPAAGGKPEAAPINQWTNTPRETKPALEIPTHTAAVKGDYIWPLSSHDVITTFGPKGAGKSSDGITIAAKKGEPVWASADGEVVYADKKLKGYGNMVIVKHKGGKLTSYAHLARMGVEKYDRVKQGDIIGYAGSSGDVAKPQLYFSIRDGSKAVDPQKYLGDSVARL